MALNTNHLCKLQKGKTNALAITKALKSKCRGKKLSCRFQEHIQHFSVYPKAFKPLKYLPFLIIYI